MAVETIQTAMPVDVTLETIQTALPTNVTVKTIQTTLTVDVTVETIQTALPVDVTVETIQTALPVDVTVETIQTALPCMDVAPKTMLNTETMPTAVAVCNKEPEVDAGHAGHKRDNEHGLSGQRKALSTPAIPPG